jgi:nitroreductase
MYMTTSILLPQISGRYSPFAFSDQLADDEKLHLIFEAAGKAPSSFNNQPWNFLYATKEQPDLFELFFNCLTESNKKWAFNAPVLVLSIAKTSFEHNGKPNRFAFYETGMASGNLLVQAMDLGLYVHQMAGFDREKAKNDLSIPEDFEPITMMAIGYPGDPMTLPAELHEKAKKRTDRKPLEKFVFRGKFPVEPK